MIEHVYRRAAAAASVSRVIVATDDRRIAEAVERFGGDARLTSPSHESGTDRLAALPPTALERAEALEQLRALECGIRIRTVETAHETIGVDTREDLERVRALMAHAITT